MLVNPSLRDVGGGHLARCHSTEHVGLPLGQGVVEVVGRELDMVEAKQPTEILKVKDLRTYYDRSSTRSPALFGLGAKQYVKAVDGVTFSVPKGAALGIVGESGCGKSTLAKTIVGLEQPSEGSLEFLGVDISKPVGRRDMAVVQELQMVFQNPDSTLNPSFAVGYQIERPLRRFKQSVRPGRKAEVHELLRAVKLDESYYDRLPRQLSGGQKQTRRHRPRHRRTSRPGLVRRAGVCPGCLGPGRHPEPAAGLAPRVRHHHGLHQP